MSNLIVSFDPGASLTKIVYELANEGKPCLMTMEPEMGSCQLLVMMKGYAL
ncbi:MAG: hypothetical protein HWQ35_14565 [Nostoc sp. NMS1]|uniref:hypothetical protein n=1 Tax=Nostoc sp. NMS1 TaxID=2815388 RepID=UPI0025E16F4E|nr:hypothetical protein [Nostoc sp. NMS1]MBN3907729.1 hypothetical protein [Nostoc sp. NMS1]